MAVLLARQFATGGFEFILDQSTSGAQTTDQTLEAGLSHVVNNQHSAYFVRAIATTEWPGSSALSVLSVTITYQISEAQ